MNSAIRVFNTAVLAEGDGGYVSEKVGGRLSSFLRAYHPVLHKDASYKN